MIHSMICTDGSLSQKDVSLEQVAAALKKPETWVWVSLEAPPAGEVDAVLNQLFHFHPLAVEDCLSTGYQAPKVDDYDDYIFIIAHALRADHALDLVDTCELNLFLGEKFLVTSYQSETSSPVQIVWDRLERDRRLVRRGPDYLCHEILDILVDEYMPLLDQVDEEIESLEDTLLDKPQSSTLQRILAIKHTMMLLRRIINPQRDVMNRLSRDDFPQISRPCRIYFRDIYDHLVRIEDLTETVRDIVSSSLDTYLSATSNRLNVVMKALTIVSTIFLPLSFVAGVYGMNFHFMPELSWQYGYPMVWVIFALIVFGMLWWFKHNDWF